MFGCCNGGRNGVVSEVGSCFSSGGKDGWGICPAHGKYQGKRHERFLSILDWEDHAETWYIFDSQIDPVKTVTDVEFTQVDWTESGVCEEDFSEDSVQGVAKLHCFLGGEG